MDLIDWNHFEKIELRSGTIISAIEFKQAIKPAFIITVDFGSELGIKKTSAQVTDLYTTSELVGKQIMGVVNFPPKQIGPFISEFLLTGLIQDDGSVVLAIPDKKVKNGLKLA
ncbi:MAG: tRNA-binding protein [Lentimicrobiaceae bacterium]|nr:tRNA-binding protein [Lentimicrobiaceae bacterium]MDG1900827.1 tRNA-binding protein [Bacteroidales bacterium]MDG2080853.1 tRNA-binding protein [Bacteroidales bacterium]